MTEHSNPPPGASTGSHDGNLVYGMEYRNTGNIDKNDHQDAACAVCEFNDRTANIYTEWGRFGSCSTEGHVKVYEGLVMSTYYWGDYKSDHVCVDMEREVHQGNQHGHQSTSYLYTTEMEGGSAHEGWYPHNLEIGCTICAAPKNRAVYTRWGHKSCPTGSTKMYDGMIAGPHNGHYGGGYNYLCMTRHSQAPPGAYTHDNNGNLLYGVEYHDTGAMNKNHGRDAACVVCQHDTASFAMVQWGRFGSCTNDMEKVYDGIVMADRYNHYASESICVDMEREYHDGEDGGHHWQGRLYTSEMESGSAHEEWYPANIEVGCTVCAPKGGASGITEEMCMPGYFFSNVTGGNCVTEAEICGAVQPFHSEFNATGEIQLEIFSHGNSKKCSFHCVHGYAWTGTQCIHVETLCKDSAPGKTSYNPAGGIGVQVTEGDFTYQCRYSVGGAGSYTRWGSRTCPTDQEKLYEGFMASKYAHHSGGGVNILCMTEHSNPPPGASTSHQNGNRLYGMEYHNTGTMDKNHNHDAACVVCAPRTPGHIYTEWGRFGSCSTEGHVKMYEGLIMANHYGHWASGAACVDIERVGHAESNTGGNSGGDLYVTEMEGGSSHEGWYPHDLELGCTVCQAPKPVYTRWGSRSCPSGSTRMYEGFMASGHDGHHGGQVNSMCMTEHSNPPPGASTGSHDGNLMYGMEYLNTGAIDKNHHHDAACAVCEYDQQDAEIYTEWGRYGSCSTEGHVKVYEGLVMANYYTQYKGEHVCVDMERAAHAASSSGHQSSGRLYTTEMEGGSSHEGWYPHDLEVGCTVCATPTKNAVYTRWGHKSCPTGSTKMYDGMIANSAHNHHGGGYNYLCMTKHSQAPPGASTGSQNGNLLYGTEYHDTGVMNKNHDRDAACVVCQHDTAAAIMTQWGRFGSCTNDMEKVYDGLVMAEYHGNYASDNICVDMEREYHEGDDGHNRDGARLWTTEMFSGASNEEWYPNYIEVGCTVCAAETSRNGSVTADMCLPEFFFEPEREDCVTEAEICQSLRPANSTFNSTGEIEMERTTPSPTPLHTCKFSCDAGFAWTAHSASTSRHCAKTALQETRLLTRKGALVCR
jgi:hypothetical protein